MAVVKPKWWGVFVRLDRGEACLFVLAHRAAGEVAAEVGGIYGWLVAIAILAHRVFIQHNMGTNGVKLKIAWNGQLFSAKRRGASRAC